MAQGSNEHRMVFDIRGRRRHVVKVVYAILAILMAASLFLVTGALNVGSIFGGGGGGESAASALQKEAEKIETKLAKTPGDETLLANLTRTRLSASNAMVTNGAFESQSGVEEVKQELAQASEDWSEYLSAATTPNASVAGQVAPAMFQRAELSSTNEEALENVKVATEAQKIVADKRPNLGSWTTLAFYTLFTQDYKAAEEAEKEAVKLAGSKFKRESLENQYEEVEKNAKEFGKGIAAEKAAKSKSAGKETLETPIQGLGAGSALGGG
jgi:hypothetical protein